MSACSNDSPSLMTISLTLRPRSRASPLRSCAGRRSFPSLLESSTVVTTPHVARCSSHRARARSAHTLAHASRVVTRGVARCDGQAPSVRLMSMRGVCSRRRPGETAEIMVTCQHTRHVSVGQGHRREVASATGSSWHAKCMQTTLEAPGASGAFPSGPDRREGSSNPTTQHRVLVA